MASLETQYQNWLAQHDFEQADVSYEYWLQTIFKRKFSDFELRKKYQSWLDDGGITENDFSFNKWKELFKYETNKNKSNFEIIETDFLVLEKEDFNAYRVYFKTNNKYLGQFIIDSNNHFSYLNNSNYGLLSSDLLNILSAGLTLLNTKI
jgi:hypothetical protein